MYSDSLTAKEFSCLPPQQVPSRSPSFATIHSAMVLLFLFFVLLRLVAGEHRELPLGLRAEVRSGAARPGRTSQTYRAQHQYMSVPRGPPAARSGSRRFTSAQRHLLVLRQDSEATRTRRATAPSPHSKGQHTSAAQSRTFSRVIDNCFFLILETIMFFDP